MKLRLWYAVFGTNDIGPSPEGMLASIRPSVEKLTWESADVSWRSGHFQISGTVVPAIRLTRIMPGEDGFSPEVRSWMAGFESQTNEPQLSRVLEHVRRTRQILHLTPFPYVLGKDKLARICEQLCGHLCRETDGMIQVYQEGFFSAQGESLLPCRPQHRLKTR